VPRKTHSSPYRTPTAVHQLIPEATRARPLWADDDAATDGVAFGFAKWHQAGALPYSFGNPTVVPVGPLYANVRCAGAMNLNLGRLSAPLVVPVFRSSVVLPTDYRSLAPGMRFNDLRRTTRLPLAGDSKVDNGEHDIRAIAGGLVAWAEDADSE
jgi:hypothetical protein